MCGRFSIQVTAEQLASEFNVVPNRMPVILSPEVRERWLSPDLTNPAELLKPCLGEWMEVIQVGAAVGIVKNDGAQLILPVG